MLARIQGVAMGAYYNIQLLPNPEDKHVSGIMSTRVPEVPWIFYCE